MDANMMQFAMEQMKKMNPEQLQAMMQNMPPDAMNQAMAQMRDMKPEDWERAKQQMAGMDSDTMARQAAQAQAQLAGRTQYVLNASIQLKQDGNRLHNAGSYSEAVEKYERAKSNVESFTSQEAKDLVRACTLNLSSCYLNLKQYTKCLEQCNQVLAGEPNNLKALYRRGQAHMGCGSWLDAAADLEKALKLAGASDPSQVQPIRDKLQETKDQIGALRASGKLPPAGASTAVSKPAEEVSSAGAATAPAAAVASRAAANSEASTSGASSSTTSGAAPSMPNAEMMARMSEMMQTNPDMMKQAQEMMRGMSDEQLQGMARQMGVDVPPGVMRSGLGNMDPELMAKVAQLQAELPPDLRGPEAARNPETMKRLADLMARKPDMAKTMGQMLSSLDPTKLQEISQAAGLPAGVTITPELAKAAAESFQRMSPEEVQATISAASSMPTPPVSSAAAPTEPPAPTSGRGSAASTRAPAATLGPAAVAGMPPVDPRMAADMLAAMSPEQLAAMTKMMPGGEKMQLTPEMAKMAAEMMKNMSADDIQQMQKMAAAMQAGGGAGAGMGGSSGTLDAAAMAAAVAGQGSSGAGGNMAQMAAEMMKTMTPEDVQRMQEMASKMGMGGAGFPGGPGLGAASTAAGANPDAMASMMSDPKMMETAVRMMKNMDPEALASMMMSSGMCKDRTQAETMARQVSSLTDAQLQMMVKTAGALQRARTAGQQALEWARRNVWLVAAVFVVVLALLLRWLGIM